MLVLRQRYLFIFYGMQKVFSCWGRYWLSKAAQCATVFLISRQQVMPGGLSVNSPALPRQPAALYWNQTAETLIFLHLSLRMSRTPSQAGSGFFPCLIP